ncbi:MAG: NUDIX domain-containing protein [Patescibacteria group bacterium]|nr:NUDIX domain-containing protein [Patescibacteria group bacterium]
MDKKRPLVGVGVMIKNKKGQVLLGLRQGSHGSGEWSFPGGHLEFGESFFQTARREAKEESGLIVGKCKLISVAEETRYLKSDDKHYVNIGILAEYRGGIPKIMEKDKCLKWKWFSLKKLPKKIFQGTELTINNYKAKKIYQEKNK